MSPAPGRWALAPACHSPDWGNANTKAETSDAAASAPVAEISFQFFIVSPSPSVRRRVAGRGLPRRRKPAMQRHVILIPHRVEMEACVRLAADDGLGNEIGCVLHPRRDGGALRVEHEPARRVVVL